MKQENDIPDKILERIRKLVRLKESTTSEGEAKAAATHVNRLLKEYNPVSYTHLRAHET